MRKPIMAIICYLAICSCSPNENKNEAVKSDEKTDVVDSITTKIEKNVLDIAALKTIKTSYVINTIGTSAYASPTIESNVLKTFNVSKEIEVIGEMGDWQMVKFQLESENGLIWKQGYIPKKDLGVKEELPMTQEMLYEVLDGDSMEKGVKLSLIGETEFKSSQGERAKLITEFCKLKPNQVIKSDTLLTIKLNSGKTQRYKILDEEKHQSMEKYEYLGHLDFMDAYVVKGIFWEEQSITIYDANTGKELFQAMEEPFVSPNKKWLIALFTNELVVGTTFKVYKIVENTSVEKVFDSGLKNWQKPYATSLFWKGNNTFITPINKMYKMDEKYYLKAEFGKY